MPEAVGPRLDMWAVDAFRWGELLVEYLAHRDACPAGMYILPDEHVLGRFIGRFFVRTGPSCRVVRFEIVYDGKTHVYPSCVPLVRILEVTPTDDEAPDCGGTSPQSYASSISSEECAQMTARPSILDAIEALPHEVDVARSYPAHERVHLSGVLHTLSRLLGGASNQLADQPYTVGAMHAQPICPHS